MNEPKDAVSIPLMGSTGYSFSLINEEPTARNLLDFVCIALAKLSNSNDPVIVESWRALERQYETGRKAGYSAGYQAGLAAGNAITLGEAEIKRISRGRPE